MQSFLRRSKVWAVLVFGLGPSGLCASPKPTDVVAEVDSFLITVADLQKKLSDGSHSRSGPSAHELKREAVNELVNEYLAKIRARSVPVENDSAFIRRADYQLSQVVSRELFNKVVVSVITIADSEIVDRYQKNPGKYWLAELVRASHILIAPVDDTLLLTGHQKESGWWADSDEKAGSIVDSLHQMILAGASFDSLARHWSQDMASGINGGDLGFFPRGQMVPAFDSVAFSLPAGAVSGPVKTIFGYHLVKVTFRQEKQRASLADSLKSVIKVELQEEKTVARSLAFIDSLHQAAGLVFSEKFFGMPDSVLRQEKNWVVASQFGDTIWTNVFASRRAAAQTMLKGASLTREQQLGLLKELINSPLVRRAAEQLGITKSLPYLAKKEQLYQGERLDRVLREATFEYNPSEEEIKAYYRQNQTEFLREESLSVHVQQMVFKTRKEVQRVLLELQAGADFSLLARKYFPGDSDIAQEAFDLGFISPPAMPKDFFAVAETLTIGAVSQPVRTPWGYHLVRVLARRPDLSLEVVRPKIVGAIRQSKQAEQKRIWEMSLREGHTIKIYDRILKRIDYRPIGTASSDRP